MKKLVTITTTTESLAQGLHGLKREEERLGVRLLAVERYYRQVQSDIEAGILSEESHEAATDVLANIEAVRYDLSTFLRQLSDRRAHIERGIKTATEIAESRAFINYIEEDIRLMTRDAATAREGYDDLIGNLHELTHQNDTDS
jgi:hypothetical protein